MGKNNVTFTELQAYLDCLKKRGVDATRIPGLPLTEADFRLWWDRITASDDLQNRWTRRIRLREQFITELAEEIIAMKSLCRVASSRRNTPPASRSCCMVTVLMRASAASFPVPQTITFRPKWERLIPGGSEGISGIGGLPF